MTSLKPLTTGQQASLRPGPVWSGLWHWLLTSSCSSLYLPLPPAQCLQGPTLSCTETQGSARQTATSVSEDSAGSEVKESPGSHARSRGDGAPVAHSRDLSATCPCVTSACLPRALWSLHPAITLSGFCCTWRLQVPSVCVKRYCSHLWQGYGFPFIHRQE